MRKKLPRFDNWHVEVRMLINCMKNTLALPTVQSLRSTNSPLISRCPTGAVPNKGHRSEKRVLVVDDHPLLREGICQLVNSQPDLIVVAQADDRVSALSLAEISKPDLVILELSLWNDDGLELIKDLRTLYPEILILVLTMRDESLYCERALRAGARGYIKKTEVSGSVLDAIRKILVGGVFTSDRVTKTILDRFTGYPASADSKELNALSDRELETLMLIGKGIQSDKIAWQMRVSVKTVESYRASIKCKLRLKTSCELLQYAIRQSNKMCTNAESR
jgi:DNA-binding NarL/FixJ family response regulator